MTSTKAEQELQRKLNAAAQALRRRDYQMLEGTLTNALLDSRSLRLLGPEGDRSIGAGRAAGPSAARFESVGLDSPAGAGADVEAERG